MRPLELELEGFTSFRKRTLIAFEGLDLFAITGPTGAGKTSLLDAIVIALYGRTPRVGREVSQLVSRGLRHLRVRFDFSVGEHRYRVARTWKMLPKSTQSEALLEAIGDGEPKFVTAKAGNVEEAITKLIGLDFDSFVRSVVLPQGQFDLFLKGEPKERQRILHHLLRMQTYERVRKLAEERTAASAQECRLLDHQISALAHANEESLADSRESLAQLEARSKTLESTLSSVAKAEAHAASLIENLRKAAEAQSQTTRNITEIDAAKAKLAAIADRESASIATAAELDAKLARNIFDEKRHLALEKCEAEARGLSEAEADKRRTAAEIMAVARKIADIEKGLATAEKGARAADRKTASATEAADEARAARDRHAQRFGSAAQVATHLALEENRLRIGAEHRERDGARTAASAALAQGVKTLAEAQAVEARAQIARDEASTACDAAQHAAAALTLRAHLHRGDTCPVCEQPVAKVPSKRKLAGLESARASLAEATQQASACAQKTASLAARLEAERSRSADIERDLKRLSEAEDSCAAKLEAYVGAPPDAGTRAQLARALADCERFEKACDSAVQALHAAEREAAAALKERDTRAAELVSEKKASAVQEKRLAEIERAIVEVQGRLGAVIGGSGLDLVRELERALARSRQAKGERESILSEIESVAASRAADRDQANVIRASLTMLEKSHRELGDAAARAEHSARQTRAQLAKAAGELDITLPESATGEAERETIGRRLAALRAAQVELAGERALATRETERIAADIEKRAAAMSRVSKLRSEERTARVLAEELKVSHFVAWLTEEALEVLAADASRHLLDFPGGGFALAVDGQDFTVVDHANAGERRSVKTLSGGESFNAALALAITFAESLADLAGSGGRNHAALESLFIDEGFGTLDAENLDAVAGAIEALYRRGRTVGIITHQPELAQRMPARIVVTKEGNTSRAEIEQA